MHIVLPSALLEFDRALRIRMHARNNADLIGLDDIAIASPVGENSSERRCIPEIPANLPADATLKTLGQLMPMEIVEIPCSKPPTAEISYGRIALCYGHHFHLPVDNSLFS